MPPDGAVGEALDRVLASATFARSGRARDLLRYIVEREQAGDADQLKGFSIALDVFGRDAEFDSSTDAVVRVQAGRLRELLAQYYAGEGAGDTLRITVPRGTYVPSYEVGSETGAAEEVASVIAPAVPGPPRARLRNQLRMIWVAIAVVIALLGFVAYRVAGDRAGVAGAATVERGDLPAVFLARSGTDESVAKVEAIFRKALAGFDTVDFIARPYALPTDPTDANRDFVFTFAPGSAPGEVAVELENAASGKALISRSIDIAHAEDFVADTLSSLAPVSGAIYAQIAGTGAGTPLIDCLLLNDGYYREPSKDGHRAAYDCFKALADTGSKSPLVYSELGALHLRGATANPPYPAGATKQEAVEFARKGIQLGPNSPYAHRAYGYLLQRLGDEQESIRWMKTAYELNAYDLSMAAAYAYALIFASDYATGTPIMERAVLASSAHPGWWDYALFLGHFMRDDIDGARRALSPIETTKRGHYYLARLIVADKRDDKAGAAALLAQIAAEYPKLSADPRSFYVNAEYPIDMVEKLLAALRSAGLAGAS